MGLQAFTIYNAMKLHFNNNVEYDMFKYNFKNKMSNETTFNRSNLKWQFIKFEKECEGKSINIISYLYYVYNYHKQAFFKFPFSSKLRAMYSKYVDTLFNEFVNLDKQNALGVVNDYPHLILQYTKDDILIETVLMYELCVKSFINSIVVDSNDVFIKDVNNKLNTHKPFVSAIIQSNNLLEKFKKLHNSSK